VNVCDRKTPGERVRAIQETNKKSFGWWHSQSPERRYPPYEGICNLIRLYGSRWWSVDFVCDRIRLSRVPDRI